MNVKQILNFLQSKSPIITNNGNYWPTDLVSLSTKTLKEIKAQLMTPLAMQVITEGVDADSLKTPAILFIETLLAHRQQQADKAKQQAELSNKIAKLAEIREMKEHNSLLSKSLEEVDAEMATLAAEMAALD